VSVRLKVKNERFVNNFCHTHNITVLFNFKLSSFSIICLPFNRHDIIIVCHYILISNIVRVCGVDMRIHVVIWASSAPYHRSALFMGVARKKFVIEIIRNHRSPCTHYYSRAVAGRTFIYIYVYGFSPI